MTRLIEADAIPYVTDETYFHEFDYAYRYAIDALPTVDAVPVRHGKWIDTKDGGICSMCKSGLKIYKKIRPLISFCPFCGADMRGEQDG